MQDCITVFVLLVKSCAWMSCAPENKFNFRIISVIIYYLKITIGFKMISGIQAEALQKILNNHPTFCLERVDKKIQILRGDVIELEATCSNDVLKFFWAGFEKSILYRKGVHQICLAQTTSAGLAGFSLTLEQCPANNKSSLAYSHITNLLYGSTDVTSLDFPIDLRHTLNQNWLGQIELVLRKFNAMHFMAESLFNDHEPIITHSKLMNFRAL